MVHLPGIFQVVALAVAVAASATQHALSLNASFPPFEVDIVFPRNETYNNQTEILPIVVAVQNLTTWTVGNRSLVFQWDIMPFADGLTPGGITYDGGQFQTPDKSSPAGEPVFLVTATNHSQWYRGTVPKNWGDKYALQLFATWEDPSSPNGPRCGDGYDVFGPVAVMFDVQTTAEADMDHWHNVTNPAIPADIPLAPACPQLDQVVNIAYNATATSCPLTLQKASPQVANPCAVKVDRAAASSISSSANSIISSMYAATAVTPLPTSTSSGGVGIVRPAQTALAAACVLCGLTF